MYEIEGILHHKGMIEEKPVGKEGNILRSQKIILKQPKRDQWSGKILKDGGNFVEFQATDDMVDKLLGINEKDNVKIEFYPRGTEYTNKAGELAWFSRLNILDIEVVKTNASQSKESAPSQPTPEQPAPSGATGDEIGDDLPF